MKSKEEGEGEKIQVNRLLPSFSFSVNASDYFLSANRPNPRSI